MPMYGWAITSNTKIWIWLIFHAQFSLNLCWQRGHKRCLFLWKVHPNKSFAILFCTCWSNTVSLDIIHKTTQSPHSRCPSRSHTSMSPPCMSFIRLYVAKITLRLIPWYMCVKLYGLVCSLCVDSLVCRQWMNNLKLFCWSMFWLQSCKYISCLNSRTWCIKNTCRRPNAMSTFHPVVLFAMVMFGLTVEKQIGA